MGGSGCVKSKAIRIATAGNKPTPRKAQAEYTKPSSPRMSPSGKGFYAGAQFENHPSCTALPPPPTHWTTPNSRSQTQPFSPTTASTTTPVIGHSNANAAVATKRVEVGKRTDNSLTNIQDNIIIMLLNNSFSTLSTPPGIINQQKTRMAFLGSQVVH
jgi:hypothetical protein